MAKLQKKYIRQAQKKVSSKQWKKRGLKTAWRLQKAAKRGRTSSPKKRNRNTRPKTNRRKRTMSKMKIPHPSVTGMAAGLNIVNYLNDAGGSYAGDSVLKKSTSGRLFPSPQPLQTHRRRLSKTGQAEKRHSANPSGSR